MPSNNCLSNMTYALCSLKMLQSIVWSGLELKDFTVTSAAAKTGRFCKTFRTAGCYVQVLSNSADKLFLNWNRDSLCSSKSAVYWGENSFGFSLWIDSWSKDAGSLENGRGQNNNEEQFNSLKLANLLFLWPRRVQVTFLYAQMY